MMDIAPDPQLLRKLAQTKMPFGRYAGRYLLDLPEPYVVWFSRSGFPEGELGQLLSLLFEVKLNGLEKILEPLRVDPGRFGRRAP